MIRSRWIGPVFGLLAWTGLAVGQQPPPPATTSTSEQILTVQEPGKAALQYKVLKSWKRADGATAYEVQSLTSGVTLTLIEPVGTTHKVISSVVTKTTLPASVDPQPVQTTRVDVPISTAQLAPNSVAAPSAEKPQPPVKATTSPFAHMPTSPKAHTPDPAVPTPKAQTVWPSAFVGQANPTTSLSNPTDPVHPAVVALPLPPVSPSYVQQPKLVAPARIVKPQPVVVAPPAPKESQTRVEEPKVVTQAPVVPPVKPPMVVIQTKPSVPAPVKPPPVYVIEAKPTPTPLPASPRTAPASELTLPEKPTLFGSLFKKDATPPVVKTPDKTAPVVVEKKIDEKKIVAAKETKADRIDPAVLARTAQTVDELGPPRPKKVQETVVLPASIAATASVPPAPVSSMKNAGMGLPPWMDDSKAPNAFTAAVPPQEMAAAAPNAFTTMQPAQPQNMAYPPMMGQGMPYPAPPMMAQAPRMDQGVPMGMSNAFVTGNSSRPIPSDFGAANVHSNAFVDPSGSMMAANPALPPRNPLPGYAPMMASAPTMSYQDPALTQALAALRTAPYPSHREVAAEHLATFDWRQQPIVLTALVASAKTDPAATVRAAAVRVLVRLKAGTPEVLAALQALKEDKDARVREETLQGLSSLGVAPVVGDSTVRPASATQMVP